MSRRSITPLRTSERAPSAERDVIDAAIRCFERFGPHKTTMGDIADEAGVSRVTLYRTFADRSTLIKAVLARRLAALRSRVRAQLAKYTDVRTALIEGSMAVVEIGRSDVLINQIMERDPERNIEHLADDTDELEADIADMWLPTLEQGRRERLLREDLSNEDVVRLIRSVHLLVWIREDLDADSQRFLLRDLLWAAISNRGL